MLLGGETWQCHVCRTGLVLVLTVLCRFFRWYELGWRLFRLFPLFWLWRWTVLNRIVLGAALHGPDMWAGLRSAVVWAGLSPGIWAGLVGLSAGFTLPV